ncbi:type I polyketide synthase, partial [Virgisporangium ochraceum]|uniref:type I polyketide synthase n=1 Tax=Virgisporangium ochraceum TaxID=65505 RepID=UPI0019426DE9
MTDSLDHIAVIGMAGRFPGAGNVDEFWSGLRLGREGVRTAGDEELVAAGVPIEALRDPAYVKAVAMAPGIDMFDAEFFGLAPREAALCDPQIRLYLETAHAALENAGYDPHRVSDVGVFGSAGVNRYIDSHAGPGVDRVRSAAGMSLGVLSNSDYIATLVSYKLNLRGPSMTVQTACSSSLVAVQLAARALNNGECVIALAGGADVEFPVGHGHWWAKGGPLTRDGHCRPFDAKASGTIFGSGVGVVALKRLSDALADGDHIRAVIRAVAINNDGADKVGFSAPGVTGQADVVVEALTIAGVDPAQVSHVEAHCTGTELGDPIELSALNRAFRRLDGDGLRQGSCALTSVKGNVGHLGHASGVTSLIKVVLSLENEAIPPTINFSEPNPKLELDGSPFFINDTLRPWPRDPARPRFAGVNSLGIGGTNVHAVVTEAPVRSSRPDDRRPRVVIWSGRTPEAENAYRDELGSHLARCDATAFGDTVDTLQHGRTAHAVRAALVARDADEAAGLLASADTLVTGAAPVVVPPAFLFPGQGSQFPAMAHDLYGHDPTFRAALDECFDLFDADGVSVRGVWSSATDDAALRDTGVAQPLLFSVGYALAAVLARWGVRPTALLGHSIGELTAATVAGVFDLPCAVTLVAARTRAMAALPRGAMLAVTATEDAVRPLLGSDAWVAAVNARDQVVVAGAEDALADLAGTLQRSGVPNHRLSTSHAFHTPAMAAARDDFLRAFDGVTARPPGIPVFSAASGALMTPEEAMDPRFWADQLTQPVRFARALDALAGHARVRPVEVGPGASLAGLARRHLGTCETPVIILPRPRTGTADDRTALRRAVARLWVDGADIDFTADLDGAPARRTVVPGYPYRRKRHWITPSGERPAAPADDRTTTASAGEPEAASPYSTTVWIETPVPEPHDSPAGDVALVLLPDDEERATDVVALLHEAGLRPVATRVGDQFSSGVLGYTVRRGSSADLARVLSDLAARGEYPRVLVHARAVDDWPAATTENVDGQVEDGVYSVVDLVQAGARAAGGHLPGLLVLTGRAVDVSGSERVERAKAVLQPLVRTLALEESRSSAKLVDATDLAATWLVEEVRNWHRSEVVAVRGDRRWVRSERPYRPAHPVGTPIRRNGVYLITGGTGGLGLEVAAALVGTGLRPRLVLLSRRGVHDRDEAHAQRIEDALSRIVAAGGVYRTLSCDVTDARAVRRALDVATSSFGPVNGVFHLAGVAGDGMIQFRRRDRIAEVLGPKVRGSLALEESFAGRPQPDFFVSFSSRSAVDGLIGGGDYAAANAFLDATPPDALPATRFLTINWPAWNTVGMAAGATGDGPPDHHGADRPPSDADVTHWSLSISPGTYPPLDEHRIDGRAVLPATAYIDLVVRAFRESVHPGDDRPIRLTDVVFQRPLVVTGTCRLEVSLATAGGTREFTVRSYLDPGPAGQVHVTGRIGRVEASGERVDLAGLRDRLRQPRTVAGRSHPNRL